MAREIRLDFVVDSDQIKDATRALESLESSIKGAESAFDKLNASAKAVDVGDIKTLSSYVDKAGKSAKEATNNFDGFNNKLGELGNTIGNFNKPTGDSITMLAGLTSRIMGAAGKLGPLGVALGSVVVGMAAMAKVTQLTLVAINALNSQLGEFQKQMNQVANSLPDVAKQGTGAIETVTALTKAMADVAGVEFDDALRGMASILGTFGGSAKETAAELGALSQIMSAKEFGDAIDWFSEYDEQIKKVGLSAEQMRNVMINSIGEGVFNDKAFDALKEFGIRINALSNDAKKQVAGAGLTEVVTQINSGAITAAEGLGKISERLRQLKADGKDITPVVSALFAATGEDMGDFVANLDKMLVLAPEVKNRFDALKSAVSDNIEANATLNKEYNKLTTKALPSLKSVSNEMNATFATMKAAFFQIAGSVIDALLPAFDSIGKALKGIREAIKSNTPEIQNWSRIIEFTVTVLSELFLWISKVTLGFVSWASGAEKASASATVFSDVIYGLIAIIASLSAATLDFIRLLWNLGEALYYVSTLQWGALVDHTKKSWNTMFKSIEKVETILQGLSKKKYDIKLGVKDIELATKKAGGLGGKVDEVGDAAKKSARELLELLKVEEAIHRQKLAALQAQIEVERAGLDSQSKYRLRLITDNALEEISLAKNTAKSKYDLEIDAINRVFAEKLAYNAKVLKMSESELTSLISDKDKAFAYERSLLDKQQSLQKELDSTTDKDARDSIKKRNNDLKEHLSVFSEVVNDKTQLTKDSTSKEIAYFSDIYELRQKELELIMNMKIAESRLALERAEGTINHINNIKALNNQLDELKGKPLSGVENERQTIDGLEKQTEATTKAYYEQLTALRERINKGELSEKSYRDTIVKLHTDYENKITDLTRKGEEQRYSILLKHMDLRRKVMNDQLSEITNMSGTLLEPLGRLVGDMLNLDNSDKELDKLKKLGEEAKKTAQEMLALGQITQKEFDGILRSIKADETVIEIGKIGNALKRFESVAVGIFSVMKGINDAAVANIEAEINIQKRKIDALKEQNKLEAERNNIILQRQAVENQLAEQRIKELETLKTTIPVAEQQRADAQIEIERKRIVNIEAMKKSQEQAAENRVRAEQRRLEQLEKRKLAMQRRAFEMQRAADIMTTIMKTAMAVMTTYAQFGFPFGIIPAVAVGAIGTAQVAMIASQKNPYQGFEKGTLWVEGGKLGKDTVPAMLAGGEAVIPYETNRMYGTALKAIYNHEISPKQLNNYINGTVDNSDVVAAILSKPTTSINIDEDGLQVYIQNSHTKTRVRNRKLRL